MKVSVKGVACVSCSDEGDDDGKDWFIDQCARHSAELHK